MIQNQFLLFLIMCKGRKYAELSRPRPAHFFGEYTLDPRLSITIELRKALSKRTPLPNPLPFGRGEGDASAGGRPLVISVIWDLELLLGWGFTHCFTRWLEAR